MGLLRKMADDDEHHRAQQGYDEGPGIERESEGLHEHEDARGDQHRCQHLPGAAAQMQQSVEKSCHLRTAPKVMPRSRCLRRRIVKTMTGTRNRVAPAATAGQSWPLTPIMV